MLEIATHLRVVIGILCFTLVGIIIGYGVPTILAVWVWMNRGRFIAAGAVVPGARSSTGQPKEVHGER